MPIRLSTLRRGALKAFGRAAAPAMLRLATGRWPSVPESAQFRHGMAGSGFGLPPLLRGLAAVPAGQLALQRATAFSWRLQSGQSAEAAGIGPSKLSGNLLAVWEGPVVGFMHFEKCAGTAVQDWLCTHFHPAQINDDPIRELSPHLFARLPPPPGTLAAKCRLIWGHYDYDMFRRGGKRPFVFTVLREPKARLVSLYNFWRSVSPAAFDPDLSFVIASAHRLPIEAFLDNEDPLLRDFLDNLYVRRLTALYATGTAADPVAAAPQAALERAMTVLSELDFVGVAEQLDDSMARLAGRLAVPRPAARLTGNVTAHNHAQADGAFRKVGPALLTPAAHAALARRTSLDTPLYQAALARFNAPDAA